MLPFCHLTLRAWRPLPPNYPKELKTVGDHILRRRLDLGLTQVELTERIGADRWTIVNWERGRALPRLRFIPKVIEFLDYNPYELKNHTLGERIRLRRESLGLSQRELSALLGTNRKSLYEWEKDTHRPSERLRAKVEAFLASHDCGTAPPK